MTHDGLDRIGTNGKGFRGDDGGVNKNDELRVLISCPQLKLTVPGAHRSNSSSSVFDCLTYGLWSSQPFNVPHPPRLSIGHGSPACVAEAFGLIASLRKH